MARRAPYTCHLCGQTWPRDPALEVVCPTCKSGVGQNCRRPSGHPLMTESRIHPDRDRLAMKTVPGYGRCPKAPPLPGDVGAVAELHIDTPPVADLPPQTFALTSPTETEPRQPDLFK